MAHVTLCCPPANVLHPSAPSIEVSSSRSFWDPLPQAEFWLLFQPTQPLVRSIPWGAYVCPHMPPRVVKELVGWQGWVLVPRACDVAVQGVWGTK